jgi:hypothetical protein
MLYEQDMNEEAYRDGSGVETTTQRGMNKAPDCIYNCCRSRVA